MNEKKYHLTFASITGGSFVHSPSVMLSEDFVVSLPVPTLFVYMQPRQRDLSWLE